MLNSVLRIVWTLVAAAVTALPAHASPCDGGQISELLRRSISELEAPYQSAKSVLMSKPAESWSDEEIVEYLTHSLKLIYFASNLENTEKCEAAEIDVFAARSAGYLNEWPMNPYDNWNPIQVNESTTTPTPGSIVIQFCPSGYETSGMQLSYQMFILGDSGQDPQDMVYPGRNSEWAAAPAGAVATLGVYSESDADRERRKEQIRQMSAE